jgi:hypothetical protein
MLWFVLRLQYLEDRVGNDTLPVRLSRNQRGAIKHLWDIIRSQELSRRSESSASVGDDNDIISPDDNNHDANVNNRFSLPKHADRDQYSNMSDSEESDSDGDEELGLGISEGVSDDDENIKCGTTGLTMRGNYCQPD